MNQDNYSKITIKGTFKAANWQELVDLFSGMYDPLSLRTFNGSANPFIADGYTRTHWNVTENKTGFGELLIQNAGKNWTDFEFIFYDKDDDNRFIKIKIDCKNKTVELIASLDNKTKLGAAIKKIQAPFSSFNSTSVPCFGKNNENKKFRQQDKVSKVISMARKNPAIAFIIILGILVISLGAVSTNFDHIVTFLKKYTPIFGQKSDIDNTVGADKQIARIHFEQSHPFVNRAAWGNDQIPVYFFQVQVFNESYDSSIRVKYLKLTDLRKLDGDVFKPWENAVPVILEWSVGTSKELSPREDVFVPFARIFPLEIQKARDTLLSGNIEILQLRFVVAGWNRQMTSHVPPGTHRFKLTVFFENEPPAEAEFQLEWSGEQRENLDSMVKNIKIKRIN